MIDPQSTPAPGTVTPDNAVPGNCGTASVWIYNESYTDLNGRRRYRARVDMGIELNYLMDSVDWTYKVSGELTSPSGHDLISPPDYTWSNGYHYLSVAPGRHTVTARYVANKTGGGTCTSGSGLSDSVDIY